MAGTAGRTGGSSRLAVLRSTLAAVAVAGLALAGCSGSGPAAPSAHSASSARTSARQALHWRPCSNVGTGLLCASLRVPVNYAKPNGRKITLALSDHPATAPKAQQQGVLLVNPGGPGGTGLSLAAVVAQGLSPSVAADYDIIGFDTRGTGASVPALHCDPSYFNPGRPNYIPSSNGAEQVWISRARSYAADCEKKYGWLLPYMNTRDFARDLNSIRIALGQRQINYFAYSYGTYLGQVFATMFPTRVRRMVLDSTVDPAGVWWQDNLDQDYAFQQRQDAFFAWAARYHGSYHLGATAAQVKASWYQARNQLVAHPVQGANGTALGPDEFDDTFLLGGYNNGYWPYLAAALTEYLRDGSPAGLVQLYREAGKQGENEFAVYNAVECSDVDWPRNWSYWNRITRKVYSTAPYEAWDNAWFNAACAFWPVKGPAKPMKIGAAGLPPILMLQGTLDAATPYAGALVARRDLPTARMVVVEGGGNHGQSLAQPPNTCVNGYLNRYLATGALPSGTGLVSATCPALPPPTPAG